MAQPEVATSLGRLVGRSEHGVDAFLGVPYAAPPLGEGRFRRAMAAEPWAGRREAVDFGASPLAAAGAPGRTLVDLTPPQTSEDCLTLNVWTPSCEPQAKRPVLVFFYGGAFVTGSSALPIYHGDALAARGNVVVVSVNYRLGLFGWLRSPELGTSGNEGLFDQAAALEWVQREIAAFGGDPAQVTVFGESAGAISIAAHLTRPGPKPFQRAILQSGAHNLLLPLGAAERARERVMKHLGNPSAGELRALPADVLLAAQDAVTPRSAGVFYGPLRDGVDLPVDPVAALRSGSAAGVAVLVGSNRDEMGFFWGRDERFDAMDDATVEALVGGLTKPRTEEVLAIYRQARAARGDRGDNRSLAMAVGADGTFRRGVLALADLQFAVASAHAYLFDWESPLFDGLVGACHVLEMPFVTGKTAHPGLTEFVGGPADAAVALSGRMMDAWASFARTGDPGWPAYDPALRPTMRFGANSRVENDPLSAERRAWAGTSGQDPRRGS